MIDLFSSYVWVWMFYLAAVLGAQILMWRLTSPLPGKELGLILQLCVFALLITPAQLEGLDHYWVPAFMAALMEGLNDGVDVAMQRLLPILTVMLALVVLSLFRRLFKPATR